MRTPAERGPIGKWLRDERAARGWKNQRTARANLARAGVSIPESVYAEYESGTRIPSEDRLAALEGYFGTSPRTESPGGGDTLAPGLSELVAFQQQLVVAFETQAQAVMALVEEMRLSRAAELEDLLARIRVLEATQRALHPELKGQEPSAQPAPRATRE